jgi:anti-anti-sigma regulatory factor
MSDQELTRDELLAEVVALRARVAELERGSEPVARPTLEQEFCRALLEHLPDGVVACDAHGNLMLFNQTSRDWHGMDAMKLPPPEWGRHYDLFGADGVTPLATEEIPLLRAFRGEHVRDVMMAVSAKGQAPRFVAAAGAPILDAGGRQIGAVAIMHDVTAQRAAEEARRASEAELREERERAEQALRQTIRHEELIRAQSLALAELSTPLIPIRDDIVVMPLIGVLDSQRVQQVMSTLLSGISERRARVAILDVTGVSGVDAQVVEGLLGVARAAALLGSQVVLTGIGPKVAQSLVSIDAALDRLVTRGTLQSGIAYAMQAVGDR